MGLNGRRVTFVVPPAYDEALQEIYEYLIARSPTPGDITQSSVLRFCVDAGHDKIRKLRKDRGRAR